LYRQALLLLHSQRMLRMLQMILQKRSHETHQMMEIPHESQGFFLVSMDFALSVCL